MPFVNMPVQCPICRGNGKIKPLSAFAHNAEKMMIACHNCVGQGMVDNKVYINPIVSPPESQKLEPIGAEVLEADALGTLSDSEVEELIEKSKSKKIKKSSREKDE